MSCFLPLYFDPGLGAMLLQAALAAVAGITLFYKTILAKIREWLGMKGDTEDTFDQAFEQNDEENDDTASAK